MNCKTLREDDKVNIVEMIKGIDKEGKAFNRNLREKQNPFTVIENNGLGIYFKDRTGHVFATIFEDLKRLEVSLI